MDLRVYVCYRKIQSDFSEFIFNFLPTFWLLIGFCVSSILFQTTSTHTQEYNRQTLKGRQWISSSNSFFFSYSLHLQRPSNPSFTRELWSSDSSNHNPLEMSFSSENGSMQKSIKGFNIVGLPWLPRLLSAIHQVALSHSLLLVSARPKTGREHYV